MSQAMTAIEADSLSAAVIEAIADVEGVDPLDLEFSLYEYIDPGALDEQAAHDGAAWEFQFDAGGHTVTVDSDRTIVVDGTVFRA